MSGVVRMGVKRAVAAAARPAQSRRAMSSEGAARLLENQKRFQVNPHLHGADNPTYLKRGPADYAVNAVGAVIVATAFTKFVRGLYHMSFGTDILDIE